jgi:thioesterase domain-containing protein
VTSETAPLDALNAALEQFVPVAARMGVRFEELRRGYVRSSVPFEGNGNHFGVMYAGVVFTVAEVLGGAMSASTFRPTTHYPLVRSMRIDFLKPGRGPLVATAELDDATIERVLAESADGTKAAFEMSAEVTGEGGVVVARTIGDYQIRPFGG